MTLSEAYEAMREAQRELDRIDSMAEKMDEMLRGRLRKVSSYELKKMKAELSQFNASTGKWKT